MLWELCPFELKKFQKHTSEAVFQRNASETAEQNLWNLVSSKDTICICAHFQELLIDWILWELCPLELKKFPNSTTDAAFQRNSSETIKHNFIKPGR
jgi:hypothetical protein